MTITFSGMATGLDSSAIVSELMSLERRPLVRLEADKTLLKDRLDSYSQFNSKLTDLLAVVDKLDSSSDFRPNSINVTEPDLFSASGVPDGRSGSSYQIEVLNLAQVQKNVTSGFSDRSADQFGSGSLSITVDGTAYNITINSGSGSLEGIMTAVNESNIGVTASIINDGTATPYRLVLTGSDAAAPFNVDATALSNGTLLTSGSATIPINQMATMAHIRVDNIDIYSANNSITDALPGITLDLLKAEPGTTAAVNINLDKTAVREQINSFVTSYNDAVAFVTGQSVINGSGGGILSGDSGLSSIKRHLQNMLTTRINSSGSINYLSQLGLETRRDGTLQINDNILDSALNDNFKDVEKLLVGESGVPGIASRFKDYLGSQTSSADGLFAQRKESTDSSLRRINNRIAQTEIRLNHREKAMNARFAALEQLISGMNAQSNFLGQQMNMLNNLITGNK
ncbi:MAG: flagellar filament capping protein FliD [Deltaproteobacteria bacterium]|nr:flagellar filament capping protein FliD [Deltaproteobacteria bacterium]